MTGTIYCFNTVVDANIYKAGRTDQESLAARLRGYLGPSKPRVLVASREVSDSIAAESLMLSLLRQSIALRWRKDYGDEWFQARTDEMDETARHEAIRLIMDVVQSALPPDVPARIKPTSKPTSAVAAASSTTTPLGEGQDTLAYMEDYFAALDRFVHGAPSPLLGEGVAALVDAFDASDACPVYVEYTLYSRGMRLAVARNRYAHLAR